MGMIRVKVTTSISDSLSQPFNNLSSSLASIHSIHGFINLTHFVVIVQDSSIHVKSPFTEKITEALTRKNAKRTFDIYQGKKGIKRRQVT